MKLPVYLSLVGAMLLLIGCSLPVTLEEIADILVASPPGTAGSAEAPFETGAPADPPPGGERATVTWIIDGDTIEVAIDGETFRVRYIGLNAPEWDEVCGSEATQANADLVAGREVTLVRDASETDRFGRLLRYVYVDEVMVNAQIVADGWAEANSYPPDVMYDAALAELGADAREDGRGCWGPAWRGAFD